LRREWRFPPPIGRRFLKQIEALFVQVLVMAREMGKAVQGSARRSLTEWPDEGC
jgi:hypothetical protein